MPPDGVATAIAAARMRAVRVQLLDLHKVLIALERQRYERAHGRIESSSEALRLLVSDPWFAWLRPLAQLIVQIDTRLADDEPVQVADLDALVATTRALVHIDQAGHGFQESYHRALQDAPDVGVVHGRLMAQLKS